jgi:hypothetical protein
VDEGDYLETSDKGNRGEVEVTVSKFEMIVKGPDYQKFTTQTRTLYANSLANLPWCQRLETLPKFGNVTLVILKVINKRNPFT